MKQLSSELSQSLKSINHSDAPWLQWSRSVLAPFESDIKDECIPVGSFLEPVSIHPEEKRRIDGVLSPTKKWKSFTTPIELKAWLKHLTSAKSKDQPSTLINFAIASYGVVRGYRLALGCDRLDRYHRSPSHLYAYEKKLEMLISQSLSKKFSWTQASFEQLCRLLPVLSQQITSYWLPIIKIAEDIKSEFSISRIAKKSLERFYDAPDSRDATDLRQAKKRLKLLFDR